MHFPTPTLTLIALATFAAAAPLEPTTSQNNTTTPSPLEKRDSYGWIGAHFIKDCLTHGPKPQEAKDYHGQKGEHGYVKGYRPTLYHNKCTPFIALTNNLGVNWGKGTYHFERLKLFNKANCSPGSMLANQQKPRGVDGNCFDGAQYPGLAAVMAIPEGDAVKTVH